jgi:hypothetical protein
MAAVILVVVASVGLLGWISQEDLNFVRHFLLGNKSLANVIAENYSVKSWSAYHDDSIFATRVNCYAADHAGRLVLLSWEVRHHDPPRDWLPQRDIYFTPLTRAAAQLAPTLLPAGVLPEDLPFAGYGSGYVYDIARDRHR